MDTDTQTLIRQVATATNVPSRSRADIRHRVRHAECADAICSCEDFRFRAKSGLNPCFHIDQVRQALDLMRQADALL
jgi:hypothetical protein